MKTLQGLLPSKIYTFRKKSLPFLVQFVLWSTIVACTIGGTISLLGYTLQGFVWIFSLVFSVFLLLRNLSKISFPWYIWVSWVVLLMIFEVVSPHDGSFQRTVMMMCPIVVGLAVSTFRVGDKEFLSFYELARKATVAFFIFVVIATGILFTGTLPEITGLAPQVMTGAILAVYFSVRYVFQGSRQLLYFWIGLVAVPIVALTRTGILATFLTFPLTLAPLALVKRLIVLALVCVCGLGLFYTERVQRKMFYTGEGEMADVRIDNPQFRMTGRTAMWEAMLNQIEKAPWFGYGANATDEFLRQYAGYTTHPHNDWLRLRFDYGYVGTIIFGLCSLLQLIHAWKKARETTGETRILFYAGASAYIPFVIFMFTDNIILYAAFFGNLHFTILGLAYASLRTSRDDQKRHKALARRAWLQAMRDQFALNNGPVR